MNLLKSIKTILKSPSKLFFYIIWINWSYSQTWEDLVLYHMLGCSNNWKYIDIWANEPCRLSNTYFFYKKWRTWINVEPNKRLLKKFFRKRPKDINLNVAVWNWESNSIKFYEFTPHTLSTCDEKTAKQYVEMWEKMISSYSVEMWTLKKIFDKYFPNEEVDILSIDVEWYDLEILKSNDWKVYHPKYIILETLEYSKDWTWKKLNDIYDPFMKKIWYNKVADTFINTIYKYR